ncbi:MAG: hypothetical protein HY584_05305, partial [Candidatus Omnitrophica bacterium]|nr:hypothetical protein [Candidatus Omnitrophota bacterium]
MKIACHRWLRLFVALLLIWNQVSIQNLLFAQSSVQIDQTATINNPTVPYTGSTQDQTGQVQPYVEQFYTGPLSPVEESKEKSSVEELKEEMEGIEQEVAMAERESFEYNLSLIAQAQEDHIPVAFVVSDLKEEDLKTLVDGNYPEVLIIAFRSEGEVKHLIYSSGSKDDIRVADAVAKTIEFLQSIGARVAHSHVEHYYSGESPLDQEHAETEEAVFTIKGAYLYGPDQETSENIGYDGLMSWLESTKIAADEKTVRDAINQLIASVDALRIELEKSPDLAASALQSFREGHVTTDPRVSTPTLYVSPTIVSVDTAGKIGAEPVYSPNFEVDILSTARLRVSYSGLDEGNEWAGVTIHNSNNTPINLSSLTELVFRLSSSEDNSDVKLEFIPVGGGTPDVLTIAGVGTIEKAYKVDLTQLTIDLSQIESINFVRDSQMTPTGQGYFDVVMPSATGYGKDPSSPDTTKSEGDVTRLALGSTTSAISDSANGASGTISNQTDLGMTLSYSGLSVPSWGAGVTWEYSATGKNYSRRQTITLGLKGTAAGARIEIQDTSGRSAIINLSGINNSEFQYYTIDLNDPAIVAQGIDLSKIRRINVVTDRGLAGNDQGTLEIKLARLTNNTPLSGTVRSVTQMKDAQGNPIAGKYEIRTYAIDPTKVSLQGKLLKHTIQENKGNQTYEITTLEVLSEGTDTGRWLSVREQKQLATNKFDIKIYAIDYDAASDTYSKGDLTSHIIQEDKGSGAFEITEYDVTSPTGPAIKITVQTTLAPGKFDIKTYEVVNNARGKLLSHVIQENIGNKTFRISTFQVNPDGTEPNPAIIESIAEQKEHGDDDFEIWTYKADGVTLDSHIRQTLIGQV